MDRIELALTGLDAEEAPAAARFDDGPPPAGRLVVLPSAFNPPTLAHLHLLREARAAAAADRSIALLTTRNVDKGIYGAPLAHRIGMLLALQRESPDLAVAASNQARIADQALALETLFPAATIDFVVGFDTLERLFSPRYYDDVERELESFFSRHRVLAANRGETDADAVARWCDEHSGRFRDRVEVLEIGEAAASVSSTQAREAERTEDASHVLPPPVRRYIAEHHLYE